MKKPENDIDTVVVTLPVRPDPLMVSIDDAMYRLGLGRNTIFKNLDKLGAVKVGARTLIPFENLKRFVIDCPLAGKITGRPIGAKDKAKRKVRGS